MKLKKIVELLDATLNLERFGHDCSNNGLQLEGCGEVRKIVFGVDGCAELFRRAADADADLVVVHHGLSWGSEPRRLTGIAAERAALLFGNGLSLYGVHLPLDAHETLGNNAQLAQMIHLRERQSCFTYDGVEIGILGKLPKALKINDIAAIYEDKLDTGAKIYGDPGREVKRIEIVSGGGGLDSLFDAARNGADLLITGEFEHVMFHPARELDLPVIALGHYASETVGVRALADYLQQQTGIACEFIDIRTGL